MSYAIVIISQPKDIKVTGYQNLTVLRRIYLNVIFNNNVFMTYQ